MELSSSQNRLIPPKPNLLKHVDSPLEHAECSAEPPSSIPLVDVLTAHPTAPIQDDSSQPAPGHELRTNIHFATLCFCLFLVGWNDGTVGPLLPRIQGVYHVGHAQNNPHEKLDLFDGVRFRSDSPWSQ